MSVLGEVRKVARGWRWTRRPLLPRSVEPPEPEARVFPTDWARTPAGRAARKLILRAGFAPLLKYEIDLNVTGAEILDEVAPPVIFYANHSSHLDAPVILTSLPNRWQDSTAVGAAADYFFDVWWRAAATSLAFNAFPVERMGARRTLKKGRVLLEEGWSLLVFPEGTRSPDGWMNEFRHGAALMATQNKVPAIPIGLRGTYQAMPKGRGWPLPGRPPVSLRFGRPLFPSDDETAREFSVRMLSALQRLLEEDRTSWWEATKRAAGGADATAIVPPAEGWRRTWESSRPIGPSRNERVWR